jgi:hypothetical protein
VLFDRSVRLSETDAPWSQGADGSVRVTTVRVEIGVRSEHSMILCLTHSTIMASCILDPALALLPLLRSVAREKQTAA